MGNWYCMLISRLLYQNPAVKAYDLQYHTQVGLVQYVLVAMNACALENFGTAVIGSLCFN